MKRETQGMAGLIVWTVLCCFGAGMFPVHAADPVPPPAPFILPPAPAPAPPSPATPIQLVPGKPFVIRLNAAIVVASPAGLVKLCTKAEPLTLIDSDGGATDYTGDKSVCIVTAVQAGACELIIVPSDGSAIGRVQLNVSGVAPPVPPTPPAPTDPLTAALQAAYTADSGADKAASLGYLQSVFRVFAATPSTDTPTTVASAASAAKNAIASPGIGLKATQLVGVRKAITVQLTADLGDPASTSPLDPAKFTAEMSKIVSSLQGVR